MVGDLQIQKTSAFDLTALGTFYDRSLPHARPIVCGFSVGDKLVVTAATAILPYTTAPHMLRVRFPYANRSFCAEEIIFHPKFDRAKVERMMREGMLLDSPELITQDFNCCLVRLTDKLPALYETDITSTLAAWHFPLGEKNDDLQGSLKELELPLVVQTLINARKHGVLYLFDDQSHPEAQIFCADGKVLSARFGSLQGALALFQILERHSATSFEFYPSDRSSYWPEILQDGSTEMLLLEGMRRLDEIQRIKETNRIDETTCFVRQLKRCNVAALTQEVQSVAASLWDVFDGRTAIGDLWWIARADDFSVYKTISELLESGQISVVENMHSEPSLPAANQRFSVIDLEIDGANRKLKTGLTVENFSFDSHSGIAKKRTGSVLEADGAISTHNINLPTSALGAPLIAGGEVVGMHLGLLTGTNSTHSNNKMVSGAQIASLLAVSTNTISQLRKEASVGVRPISKPVKKRIVAGGSWKTTLIWFVLGFIVVLGIKFVASLVSP